MRNKKIYKLIYGVWDCYDCDYIGNDADLIHPFNKLFTKVFLTEELRSTINKELKGNAYQKFHLVVKFIPFEKNEAIKEVNVGIEYDCNLIATSKYYDLIRDYTITSVVNEYIHNLGYPLGSCNANDFLDKLIEEHPEFAEYFNVELAK